MSYLENKPTIDIWNPHGGIESDILVLSQILTPIDLEVLFNKSPNAKIVNQGHLVAKKLSEEFTKSIFAESDADIPFIPRCSCGYMNGKVLEGQVCSKCGTTVSTEFVDHLAHIAWLSIPDGFPKLLHPVWYMILKDWLGGKKGESSVLDSILNPNRNINPELAKVVREQGYTYFYKNHEEIMDFLLNKFDITRKKKNTPWVRRMYYFYKHIMFTSKFPILHNSLHPYISGSATLKYVDKPCQEILKAAYDLSLITFDNYSEIKRRNISQRSQYRINCTLYDIYNNLIAYYHMIIKEKVGKKEALMRKHNLGTRAHFTVRGVVVPIVGAHNFEDIYLPWKAVVNTYILEIMNKLVYKYKLSPPQAEIRHLYALLHYDELIHKIILELIEECPYRGLPFLIGRNPTLRLFSIMQLFCPVVKTDIYDETFSLSPGILKGANIDFDGDEGNGFNLKEQMMVEDFNTMHPREAVLDTNSPRVSSNLVKLSDQASLNLHRFIHQNPDVGYQIIGGAL